MSKRYLTEAQLIAKGVLHARRTAGRAVRRGELPQPIRTGHHYVFDEEEVDALMEARKGKTAFASGKTLAGSGRKKKLPIVIKRSRRP